MKPLPARLPTGPVAAALVLAAAAALAPGSPARAQARDQGPDREDGARAAAETAPEARRVLVLADGRVLRGESRLANGRWEVRAGRAWQALPPGAVAEARLEADLKKEARARERALGSRPDPDERAAHAAWLLRAGLQSEALAELDRVLAVEPDHPGALAALSELGPRLALPPAAGGEAALEAFLDQACRLSPSARELAVLRLGAEAEPGLALARLRADLERGTNLRRAFAGLALRRLHPGEALEPLLRRAVLDGSETVRREASLALGAARSPAVVVPVARALASGSPAVAANAAEALGNMGYAAGVPALMGALLGPEGYRPPAAHVFVGSQRAYIQDFDVEVANNASVGDPEIGVLSEGAVLDVRVLAVTADSGSRAAAARRALRHLTGADPGGTTAAWRRWWSEHEAEWLARAAAEAGPPRPATTGG